MSIDMTYACLCRKRTRTENHDVIDGSGRECIRSLSERPGFQTRERGNIMGTNPYEYDRSVPWIPQQNQYYAEREAAVRPRQQPSNLQNQRPQQKGQGQKPKPMPKARTLALVHTFKKWLVVASFVGFGTLSGLAAFHQVAATTTTTASQTKQTTSSSSQKSTTSSSSSSGFLGQQGGNNFGTGSSSQGSNSNSSSTSGSSSSSSPVSGSQTS